MLEINSTLFIQIGNFLLLVFLLNIFLYRPIRRVLSQRNQETNSLEKTIADYQERSEEDEKNIADRMVLARKEGYSEKEGFKGRGREEEKGILQETNSSVEEKIGSARKEMEIRLAEARERLEDELGSFSRELAQKILGRDI